MKEGVESLGRVRAQALVLLAIAFLAGAFVGGTIERVMARPSRSASRGYPRGGSPTVRAPRQPGSLPGWYEPLNLTPDQRSKIEAILAKRSARVDSVMKIACAVLGPARDSSSKEADAVLTSDQRTKRDSIRAARQSTGRGPRGPMMCAPPTSATASAR
jgi:Spy/CpxP family protein refolding chaperone